MLAVVSDDPERVEALLALGVDNLELKEDENGWTSLHFAAVQAQPASVRALLAAGAPIEARDFQGKTPLVFAASGGCTECLDALIAAGAHLDARDNHGSTAVHYAALFGSAACLRALINAGADSENVGAYTAAHRLTAMIGSEACMRVLSALAGSNE